MTTGDIIALIGFAFGVGLVAGALLTLYLKSDTHP